MRTAATRVTYMWETWEQCMVSENSTKNKQVRHNNPKKFNLVYDKCCIQQFWTLHTQKSKWKFKKNLQQKIDILNESYCVQGTIKSTACKYNIDPIQIRHWKKKLSCLNLDSSISALWILLSASPRGSRQALAKAYMLF